MNIISALSAIPLPLPLFLIFVTFLYGVAKFFFPELPFTEEQLQFLLQNLLALLGVVITANLRAQRLI